MKPPNGEALEALKRVAARPEGQLVLGYLQQEADELGQRLVLEADPTQLRIWQGEARAISVLLKVWKP